MNKLLELEQSRMEKLVSLCILPNPASNSGHLSDPSAQLVAVLVGKPPWCQTLFACTNQILSNSIPQYFTESYKNIKLGISEYKSAEGFLTYTEGATLKHKH